MYRNAIRNIAAGLVLAIGVTAAAPSFAAAPAIGRSATVDAGKPVETVDYRKHRRDRRHGWNKQRRHHHWQPRYGYYKPWRPYYGYYGYYVPRPYWGYGY